MLPAVFCMQFRERIKMIIQKFKQEQYINKREARLNTPNHQAIKFTGKKELLQDLVNIASSAQKSFIIEDSSLVKKIGLTEGGKTYEILSREIEKFKNIFSYRKQTLSIHELKVSTNGKKFKTKKLKAHEFEPTYSKLKEIVIPQVLKQVDTSIATPTDLLKAIGNGLINGNLQTG